MKIDWIFALLMVIFLIGYLVYAMLFPEKF
ncbi:MAG TPA: K(+)-transporting ATPase subunit F [bacterium]|nr:K(+)-transporting ATPase subunit F [bacterium]HQG45114.1 K(+)-transporting ATPase subunit F [bacterium]HQI47357.1 K(+)-transporting ATPase subunit F [bacterium]HQJ63041.1 K(+)-transporting ATPase subunit F [bacterium]